MITAKFTMHNGFFESASVSGHAEYADPPHDIVCAGVTSAVQLVANGITEVLGCKNAKIIAKSNLVSLTLPEDTPQSAAQLLAALHLQLLALQEDYPENIEVITTEV